MANPLPKEKELYQQLKEEKAAISPEIWDLLYNRLGDGITSINLLCRYYLNETTPIPISEAKKILLYTRHIKEIVNKVAAVSNKDFPFPEFSDGIPLHPILREMFTHYIGNDIYIINLIVLDSVDPKDPRDVPLDSIQRILAHTRTIREFMDKLREATLKGVAPQEETADIPAPNPKILSKKEIFLKIRSLLVQEFKLANEKIIKPESRFNEDLKLDSVDAIRVIMALEDGFGIEIPDSDAAGVLTVAQAADYVRNKLRKKT